MQHYKAEFIAILASARQPFRGDPAIVNVLCGHPIPIDPYGLSEKRKNNDSDKGVRFCLEDLPSFGDGAHWTKHTR